ncbi:putative methyltransferase [Babesia sp. Xinjiang]|uniref:putative methyltransferase n=1 Tax=Babesia sp. Xinjiang TaxID=462227 RepID=UPI000A24C40E|nr:putative methyltransferase [Babesia sp. Xinjiang]ORM39649.1 putative methyltransferase [Babesia sp. Xinjiang]
MAGELGMQLRMCVWKPLEVNKVIWMHRIREYGINRDISVRCIHHGFHFDRISTYKPTSALPANELDDVSRISIKTLPFPNEVTKKLFQLIKAAGKKKDIDACGSYISKRLAARRCVEVPRVLPSLLLDANSTDTEYLDALKKMSSDPRFEHLKELLQQNRLGPNEQAQIELAAAEDSRHKNYTIHFSPNIAIAHTAHTFFGYYAVCLRIFNEINLRAPNFKPSRIMFYSAGAGASVAAAHTIWDLDTFEDILVVEPSQNLLNICEYLLPEFKNKRHQSDIYDSTELFDCIVVPYHLTNIRGSPARSLLVKNLWNRVNIGGYMVFVEVGTPTGFRILHSIREVFISQLEKGYFHFLAPCPHEGICPLALTGKDWCHFSQRIYRIPHYLYKKGSIARSIDNEKFSYLVVGKSPGPRHKLKSEAEAKSADEKSFFWPRLVMPPLKLGRRVIMDVCSAPNNFKRIIVSKNTPEVGGYKYARDAMWGDLWRFPYREQQPVARAYTPESVKRRVLNNDDLQANVKESIEHTDVKVKEKIERDLVRHYGG